MGAVGRRSPEREAEFSRIRDEAKTRHRISDVASRKTALKRAGGRAQKGLCPFHKEKSPSFHVYDFGGNFHCYGCGANGDIIDLVMGLERLDFLGALRWLGASELPDYDPAERVREVETEKAERLQAISDARAFFADAVDPQGTRGEAYLAARGISLPIAPSVRFAEVPARRNEESGEWGPARPALICGCQDFGGTFMAIQRIFVDGPRLDKAACKLSLGSLKGSALRLGPVAPEIIVPEGVEDGLSIAQEMPGRSVWVPCGTGLMPFLRFPPAVRSVMLAGQNDEPGRRAVDASAAAFLDHGLKIGKMWPAPNFGDWNDMLRGSQ